MDDGNMLIENHVKANMFCLSTLTVDRHIVAVINHKSRQH